MLEYFLAKSQAIFFILELQNNKTQNTKIIVKLKWIVCVVQRNLYLDMYKHIYIYIQQALFGIEIMIIFGKINKLNTYIN